MEGFFEKAVYHDPTGQCGLRATSCFSAACWKWAWTPTRRPSTKYRGKEQLITPSRTLETYRQEYEIKWRELEPTLRAYYQ